MREILFRGKLHNDGRWIAWSLLGAIFADKSIEVDFDTVGQCTGLNDKNGKKIFEGDIVHCLSNTDCGNCVVIFEEGEFRLVPDRYYKTYTTGGGYHAIRCFIKEVIGNIHDNPELMKGGDQT